MVVFLLLALIAILLWAAGVYIAPIGQFYGFVFSLPAKLCTRLEQYLQPFQTKADSTYPGLATIIRILLGSVATLACISEIYGGIQAAGTLFGVSDTSVPFLPSNLATPALGVTFLCLAIIAGMGYMESEGYVPVQARIFEQLDQTKTARLQKLMLWCLSLSLVATFFAFLERKMYQIDKESPVTFILQLLVFALLGVLLPLISMFAWYYIAVGFEAFLALGLGLAHFIIASAREVFVFFTRYFAGTEDVATKITTVTEGETPLLPAPAMATEMENSKMPDAFASLVLIGRFGSQLSPLLRKQLIIHAAKKYVRTSLLLDLNQPRLEGFGIGKDVGVPYATRVAALASTKNDPKPVQKAYEKLLDEIGNNQVEEHSTVKSVPQLLFYVLDCHIGAASLTFLREVYTRISSHTIAAPPTICVITSVSPVDRSDDEVLALLKALEKLVIDGIIAGVGVIDPASPFGKHGEEKMLEEVAASLVALAVSHTQDILNPSGIDILHGLGRNAPFFSFGFASNETVAGEKKSVWSLFSKKARTGDISDMLQQANGITRDVTSSAALAYDAVVDENILSIFQYTAPLEVRDPRLHAFAAEIDRDTRNLLPHARTATISGNAMPVDLRAAKAWRVGVTLLFSLPADVF